MVRSSKDKLKERYIFHKVYTGVDVLEKHLNRLNKTSEEIEDLIEVYLTIFMNDLYEEYNRFFSESLSKFIKDNNLDIDVEKFITEFDEFFMR